MPTKIIYSEGSIDNIDEYINNRKTLLVTSKSVVSRGLVVKIKSLTRNIVHVVADIESHPSFSKLEHTYNQIKNLDFEPILAIGGGSVIDSSKFLSSLLGSTLLKRFLLEAYNLTITKVSPPT